MISIQPGWCERIASGEKKLEVRKTRPKLETPFKCYIYQTKAKWAFDFLREIGFDEIANLLSRSFGMVIGEFVCDGIKCFDVPYPAFQDKLDKRILEGSCCTYYQLHRYAYHDNLYGWHISDPVIYGKPKELSEFMKPCKNDLYCEVCAMYSEFSERCLNKALVLSRPPQSWCYVEELEGSTK